MKKTMMKAFIMFWTLAMPCAIALAQGTDEPKFVPGELLIQFRSGSSDADKELVRTLANAWRTEKIREDLELASLPAAVAIMPLIQTLRGYQAVLNAEPNWIYTRQAVPNDPRYTDGSLWGMYGATTTPQNANGSRAGEVWSRDITGSRNVLVGVIDEGIDLNHPDLGANIWTNPFDPLDGLDNDGNGFRDDIHGWDFANNDNTIYDGRPGDNNTDSHGTHVSGTIGALGGNGIGVVGVNWNVTIISAKFLGPFGGTTANAIRAVDYLTDLKTRHGLNLAATNNSWGGGGYSASLHAAIIRAAKAGILFVAAAGNNGTNNDTSPHYPSSYNTAQATSPPSEPPATYDAVIAVASITSLGARSGFSNFGLNSVDLGAPGSAIWSTTPNNTYSSFSGTSMATPHVTGSAALYRSQNPASTALQIKTAILDSAVATPTFDLRPGGPTPTVTGGRLNISHMIPAPASTVPPAAPSGLAAAAVSATQINLTWTDVSDNEANFLVERCQGAGCIAFVQIAQLGANVTSFSDTGLTASTTYRYQVKASNAAGTSAASNIAEATTPAPPPPPAAPSGLIATAVSASQINLSWTDNSLDESGFSIERCQGAGCTTFAQIAQVGAGVTSFSNTGLLAATTYAYRVRAFNANGNSGFSNTAEATTQTPPPIPAAPSNLTVQTFRQGQTVWNVLNWTDNSTNETNFVLERCTGETCTNFALLVLLGANVISHQDNAVVRGTFYRYRVKAQNAAGDSPYSNIVTIRTR